MDGAFFRSMFRRIPYATILLLVWLALCFVFEEAIQAFIQPRRIGYYLGISWQAATGGHFFRFATANFFHINLGHFISNAIGLAVFLLLLEYAIGSCRATLVVLVSALGGAAGSVIFRWVQYMVGASTILFGVYGALGVLVFKYRKEFGRFFPLIAAIWIINLAGSVLAGYISLAVVDQGAHIGGFAAGAVAAACIARGRSLQELQNPASARMRIGAAVLVAVFGIGFFVEALTLWPLLYS